MRELAFGLHDIITERVYVSVNTEALDIEKSKREKKRPTVWERTWVWVWDSGDVT